MKLRALLDTTYFLPAIGIGIKNLPTDIPIRLMKKGHQISISSITIFELSAKGAKYVASGRIPSEKVMRGIRALVYNENIDIVESHDSSILHIAFKIRKSLCDFIDCLILSSAINHCDLLLTEDADLHNIRAGKEYHEITTAKNPDFKIFSAKDLI
ncbi:MAG: PIN domain-containing protein [Candidatus Methanomethyliaceae archaeon]